MNWQTIYNEDGIEGSVLIEDGKPVRLSVSPADAEVEKVERTFERLFPQHELSRSWDQPSTENCVVCSTKEKGEWSAAYPIAAVANGVITRLIEPLPVGYYYYCVRYDPDEFNDLPAIPLDVLWPAGFDGESEYPAHIDRAKLLPMALRPASWDESNSTKHVTVISCEHFSFDPHVPVTCDCKGTEARYVGHWS